MAFLPLTGIRVISLAVNLPGPLAAARCVEMGAQVTKIVPPGGDPLARVTPEWHDALVVGQEVLTLDLRTAEGQTRLAARLADADVLLTATRPAGLARLGLDWPTLSERYPRLCHVAIVGYPTPDEERAGHDLTYQASVGLVKPPDFPRIPLADYAGSERAVSAILALLWMRDRTGRGSQELVSLVEALAPYSYALCYGLFEAGTFLGGGSPIYHLYPASEGWVAVAALEPQFQRRLADALGLAELSREALAEAFLQRTADEWENWSKVHDIPLAAVRDPLCP